MLCSSSTGDIDNKDNSAHAGSGAKAEPGNSPAVAGAKAEPGKITKNKMQTLFACYHHPVANFLFLFFLSYAHFSPRRRLTMVLTQSPIPREKERETMLIIWATPLAWQLSGNALANYSLKISQAGARCSVG